MAVQIWLRVGDTSTYDILLTSTGNGVRVLDTPWMNAPDISQQTLQSLGDGNSLGVPSFSNVTESLELHIRDTTAALVADKVRAIERLLDLARQGTLGHLQDKLYLRIQFDHDAVVWRSQILAAKLEMAKGTNQIWLNFVEATLIITRRYFWEAETPVTLAATTAIHTTPTADFVTIYNSDDSTSPFFNWVDIAASQVTGSLPAPAKLEVKNTSGSNRDFSALYIGNYVFAGSNTVDPIFRGEDATFSNTTPIATEQEIYTWAMGALADSFRGQFGRFVVVWSDRPAATTLVRGLVDFRSPVPTLPLALGELMLPGSDAVLDLGGLPIPPGAWVAGGIGDKMALTLHAKTASGTDTLSIDWLQIFPSGKGFYRVIKGITSVTMANNEIVVDDGSAGAVYSVDGSDIYVNLRPFFDPIYLWPGRQQRLRFVISGGTSIEGQPWAIKTSYRPRRLSF